MTADTAKPIEALDRVAQSLLGVFKASGYEPVAPPIIQPADVFLDVLGETLRARTFVFTDPDGEELCLRPDLTVPACRLHLSRDPEARGTARYCYNGPAFRFDRATPGGRGDAREFLQTGLEAFGETDREAAEARVVGTIMAALTGAGLKGASLRFGDLGLFRALLAAADMPDRWRQRLKYHFWHPDLFHAELKRLATEPGAQAAAIPTPLRETLDPEKPQDAEALVQRYLDQAGIEAVGNRSTAEISASLLERVADARSAPLAPKTAQLIASYVSIVAPAKAAAKRIGELATLMGLDLSAALFSYDQRIALLEAHGVDLDGAVFSAEFGRALEYYTGFIFEVHAEPLGQRRPIAGGGRYDDLLRQAGAPRDVPAVGAAIHTERLQAVLSGGAHV